MEVRCGRPVSTGPEHDLHPLWFESILFFCDEQRRHGRKDPYDVNPVHAEEARPAHQSGLVAVVSSQAGKNNARRSSERVCASQLERDKMKFAKKKRK